MVQSLQPRGRELESTYMYVLLFLYFYLYSIRLTSFSIDVPRSLSNVIWIIIFKGLRNAYTEPVCLEHLRASKKNSIRNKTPETPIFNFVNIVTLQSYLFIYTCICYCYCCRILTENASSYFSYCDGVPRSLRTRHI